MEHGYSFCYVAERAKTVEPVWSANISDCRSL
jgi:hypothetical protein